MLRCYLSFTIEVHVFTQISFQALNKISCTEDVLTRRQRREQGSGRGKAGGGGGGGGSGGIESGKLGRGPGIKAQTGKWGCAIFLNVSLLCFQDVTKSYTDTYKT